MKAAVFDLDGTLSDGSHRNHLIESGEIDWHEAFLDSINDPPILPMVTLLEHISPHNHIFICTSRLEAYRKITEEWLSMHVRAPIQGVYMRPLGDYRPDWNVKTSQVFKILEDGYSISVAFDDREDVISQWRRMGIFCAQTANHTVKGVYLDYSDLERIAISDPRIHG